jgi:myo-inositol 2-dehydrogenase/D-chiro-inositol 1-dehydrogenase
VRAVTDLDLARAESVAAGIPGAQALSAESLIAAPDVDSVIVASSDATHAGYVKAAIAANKPVLCEKPLAPTVSECEEILHLEEAKGVRLIQVGFMRQFDPGYAELRQRILSGAIGAPLLAHCVHRNADVPAGWTSEMTILSAAAHEIHVMPWIFGRDVVRVNWVSPSPDTATVRDPQIIILELEGGALVFVEIFAKCRYGYEIRCEVVGQSGTIELASLARVSLRTDREVRHNIHADFRGRFAEAYRRELQAWVNAVSRWLAQPGVEPIDGPDIWEGYRVAAISKAVLDSMATGGAVAVRSMPMPELYRRGRSATEMPYTKGPPSDRIGDG